MILRRKLPWFLILSAAFSAPALMAQQVSGESTGLALEVHFYPKEAPAYQAVPAAPPRGAWYARFGHVRDWKHPPDSPAVTAVNIKSELAEDVVRVWVSVFLGELHEQETKVNSYMLHAGEQVSVRELAQFGVEPFEIKIVRLTPSFGDVPQFTSKAKSIEVVVMQPNLSTLPSYDVVVRNLSSKNISALQVQVLQGGRRRIETMPQGREGQPLIVPIGTYEFKAPLATRATPSPDGYAPLILPNQVIEISSAVFDDGSFEGDSDPAITFMAFQKGRKIQLERVLVLLQKSLAASDSAPATTLNRLKVDVGTLNLEADSAAVNDVHSKFPDLPSSKDRHLKTTIEVSMKGLRDEVLNDITQFELRNRRVDSNTFHDWLTASKQRYEAWLARL